LYGFETCPSTKVVACQPESLKTHDSILSRAYGVDQDWYRDKGLVVSQVQHDLLVVDQGLGYPANEADRTSCGAPRLAQLRRWRPSGQRGGQVAPNDNAIFLDWIFWVHLATIDLTSRRAEHPHD